MELQSEIDELSNSEASGISYAETCLLFLAKNEKEFFKLINESRVCVFLFDDIYKVFVRKMGLPKIEDIEISEKEELDTMVNDWYKGSDPGRKRCFFKMMHCITHLAQLKILKQEQYEQSRKRQ